MSQKRIYLCLAHMSGKEQQFIQEAFDTNWVVPLGPNVNGFEADLEAFVGEDKKVVALSAGTAAVHLALIACGVGAGDEVLCQSFTFCASANPITYLGATPVFVDSERDTWNMDPELLEKAIEDRIAKTGKKPKAPYAAAPLPQRNPRRRTVPAKPFYRKAFPGIFRWTAVQNRPSSTAPCSHRHQKGSYRAFAFQTPYGLPPDGTVPHRVFCFHPPLLHRDICRYGQPSQGLRLRI